MRRIRLSYSKTQALRYTGNLDMQKIWERFLRRSGLPLAYSQGFHPQPRINQAAPLPLGMLSRCEIVDFWLQEDIPLAMISTSLQATSQPGIELHGIVLIDHRDPSLQTQVKSAEYLATLLTDHPPAAQSIEIYQDKIKQLLAATELIRIWRKKSYDLRKLVIHIELQPKNTQSVGIRMHLRVGEGMTGRPEEVLSALAIDPHLARIERLAIHL